MATNVNPEFGYYTSTGAAVYIPVRSGIDYFEILNLTQMATTNGTGQVVESKWQRGFSAGYAQQVVKTNSTNALNGTVATTQGFTVVNTSSNVGQLAAPVVYSAVNNASPPVVSTSSTAGLYTGTSVVQIASTSGNYNLAGMQFTVGTIVSNTSFQLAYMGSPGAVAPGAGTYSIVNWDVLYAPRRRLITNITQANSCVVTLSVTHNYVVGEMVQLIIPSVFGMTQANNMIAQISAINTTTNTVTLNLNTSSYSAFTFPSTTSVPFTYAQMLPVGEIPTISSQATQNASRLTILCDLNTQGNVGDQLFWRAWQAFTNNNGSLPTS